MQLVPNDDDNNDCYDMIPRGGAFEVSAVIDRGNMSADILFFSKILGKMWPNCTGLAKKLGQYWAKVKDGSMTPEVLKENFTFNLETL